MSKAKTKPWTFSVGVAPYQVTAFEDPRSGKVKLRWYKRVQGERQRILRSLGFSVRGARGGLDEGAEQRAIEAARQWQQELAAGTWSKQPVVRKNAAAPLTIRQGWDCAKDREKGNATWIVESPYRDDIDRAIDRAESIWGVSFTWDQVDRGALRQLWRRVLAILRAQGHGGYRGAELTIDLVLAVGAWLRDEQLIAATAALRWNGLMDEFRKDAGEHVPHRPRYTVEEYRKLFAAAWEADERYGLLYDLGAEYRLGQVAPMYRRHLDLERGRLQIKGHGKKKGEVVILTEAQLANVRYVLTTGYLAGLESAYQAKAVPDYPLFPGDHFALTDEGRLMSRADYATRDPIYSSAWRRWHRKTEELAGIEHVLGRGPYGSRRGGVDGAKELQISREGMRAWGGWGNQQMPDKVYADQEADYARAEASKVRAQVRGEATGPGASRTSQDLPPPNESPKWSRDHPETPNGDGSADPPPSTPTS